MTNRERAIVMACTGVSMLTGDKLGLFYEYVEEILGESVVTHEIALRAEEIKEKAKPDFLQLCATSEPEQKRPRIYAMPKCKHYLPCRWCEKNDSVCTWVI